MSWAKGVESLARLVATDANTTKRPSALMAGDPALSPLASAPELLTLIRSVVPSCRSRKKTSHTLFLSLRTKFEASEAKTT